MNGILVVLAQWTVSSSKAQPSTPSISESPFGTKLTHFSYFYSYCLSRDELVVHSPEREPLKNKSVDKNETSILRSLHFSSRLTIFRSYYWDISAVSTTVDQILYFGSSLVRRTFHTVFINQHGRVTLTDWKCSVNDEANAPEQFATRRLHSLTCVVQFAFRLSGDCLL